MLQQCEVAKESGLAALRTLILGSLSQGTELLPNKFPLNLVAKGVGTKAQQLAASPRHRLPSHPQTAAGSGLRLRLP